MILLELWLLIWGLVFAVGALVCAAMAFKHDRQSSSQAENLKLALSLAGAVLGFIGALCLMIAFLNTSSSLPSIMHQKSTVQQYAPDH